MNVTNIIPYMTHRVLNIILKMAAVGTHLQAFLFTSFTLLVIGVLAPVAVAVRVVGEEGVVGFAGSFGVALKTVTILIL